MPLRQLNEVVRQGKIKIDYLEHIHQTLVDNINAPTGRVSDFPVELSANGNEITALIFGIEVSASKRFVRQQSNTGKVDYFLEYTFHANHQGIKVKIWQFYLDENSDLFDVLDNNPLCNSTQNVTTKDTICYFLAHGLLLSPVFEPA